MTTLAGCQPAAAGRAGRMNVVRFNLRRLLAAMSCFAFGFMVAAAFNWPGHRLDKDDFLHGSVIVGAMLLGLAALFGRPKVWCAVGVLVLLGLYFFSHPNMFESLLSVREHVLRV